MGALTKNLRTMRISLEAAALQHGWLWPVAFLLSVIALLILLGGMLPLRADTQTLSREIAQLANHPEAVQAPADPYTAFTTVLIDPAQTSQHLQQVFGHLQKAGIKTQQADYQYHSAKHGDFDVMRVSIPVVGSYVAIRQGIANILRHMPGVSVDQVSFERDTAGSARVDGQIRLSLWLRPAKKGDTR